MPRWTIEQEQAINEKGSNIIVSAGAGSGKTAVLSERVIRILKEGVHVNELLILTFTKKAAFEMKERIRTKISKEESLREELDYLDSSYITTFDSFALSIVKKYNYLLNISKNISIIDASIIDLVKNKIIDNIFDKLYEENNPKFLNLIDKLTIKNDKDIKKYILNINRYLDLKYDKNEYLNNYISDYYNESNINSLFSLYEEIVFSKVKEIDKLLTILSNYLDTDYMNKLYDSVNSLLNSTDYDSVRNNSLVKLPQLPRGSEEEAKTVKEQISDLIKEVNDLTIYSKNELIDNLLSTKDFVEIIITIINLLDKDINNYKLDNNLYEFTDISKMAIKVLKDNDEVKDELKYFFKEIMIDEYQDTSDLQDIFISMIDNHNVYMVGDIKQSIYRFRNANPYLFKTKYDDYSKNINGLKIDLTKNFRSREQVINNINLIFSDIMTNSLGGAEYKDSHKMVFGNTSYNEIDTKQDYDMEILDYDYDKESKYSKKEIEIFTIANDIKNKIDSKYQIFDKDKQITRDIKYSDCVILLDRSTNFDLFKKIFEYLGIPINKYTSSSLMDSVEVYLIKNIINLIISIKNSNYDTNFKYSLTSILRSYLFSYKDEDIFKILDNNLLDNEVINMIKEITKDIDYLSLGEIIELIIDKFDFYNKTLLVGDVVKRNKNIDEIIKIFNNLAESKYDLIEAYNYLNDLIEEEYSIDIDDKEELDDSVKIMTIHASKGLEFSICYFAFLDAKFNISELNEKFIYSNKYGILSPFYNEGIGTTFVKSLIKDDYLLEEVSEKIRLFYVALTRAKEKIYLITNFGDKTNTSLKDSKSFLDFLYTIKDILDPYIKKIDVNSINLTKDYNLIKETNYKKSITSTKDKIEFKELKYTNTDIKSKRISKSIKELNNKEVVDKLNFGTKIHKILEIIDFRNPDYNSLNIDDYYIGKIKSLINQLDLSKVINIYKEYEFIYTSDDTKKRGIIDLMLEYDDRISIIDYKLKNIDDDEYLRQLDEYKKYIETKTSKKVETYLYSINNEKLEKTKKL